MTRRPPRARATRGRPARLPLVVVSAILLAFAWAGAGGPGDDVFLTVTLAPATSDATDVTIVQVSLRDDPTWEIRWRHSVAGILVTDRFAWRDGRMVLTDSFVPLLDVAGLGQAPGEGVLRTLPDGTTWIAGLDRVIPGAGYWLRIGPPDAPTVLVHAGREYPLSHAHPGRRARVAVVSP